MHSLQFIKNNSIFPAKWSYLVVMFKSLGAAHFKYTVNNTEPSGMKWYYHSYYDNNKTDSGKKRFFSESFYFPVVSGPLQLQNNIFCS